MPSGQKYRMDLSYVGTHFSGFQSQWNGNAVQDYIERACHIFFKQKVRLKGASRTDSGVHAQQQVASFETEKPFVLEKWKGALNALVGPGIGINHIEPVASDFHPIASAKAKVYRYSLWLGHCHNPFLEPYVWPVHKNLDLGLLEKEAQNFIGVHDFKAFCNVGSYARTTVREVLDIKVDMRLPVIDIWILGRGFLKQMVRIMVGSLIELALSKNPTFGISDMLLAKDRNQAGQTAPPQGLTLVQIYYDEIPQLSDVILKNQQGYCLCLH